MFPPVAPLAFLMPSMGEWTVILIIGVMVFGRRLPEVGRQLGRTVGKMRRGFDEFRREMERDENLRDVHSSVRDVRDALHAPIRALDPRRFISDSLRDAEPKQLDFHEEHGDESGHGSDHEPDHEPAGHEPALPIEPPEEARRSADAASTAETPDAPPAGG